MQTTPSSSSSSSIDNIDIAKYMVGTWKRCLEFRQFGGLFQHLSTSNTVVSIEEANKLMDSDSNVRYLRWSFGKSSARSDLRFGYEMKVKQLNQSVPNHSLSSSPPSVFSSPFQSIQSGTQSDQVQKQTVFEWQISGVTCEGHFYHESKVAVFNFILKQSIVTVTYRVMDENTMAVCIVEIDDKQQPTIQYGNMYRL